MNENTTADTLTQKQKRTRALVLGIGFSAVYTSGMILLHDAWYKYDEKSNFHFYDDASHWYQVDKAGHFWTAFHQSRLGVDVLKWAGTKEKKAIWFGSMAGFVLQLPIEVFDGYSKEYGASGADLLANALGAGSVTAQHLIWQEVRIMPKFSFRPTTFPVNRLQMLGENYFEQALKDYNGQTYWLSADVSAFLPKTSNYPKWLNVAVGYGANGMVTGDPQENRRKGYDAYRQYYLSLDINLMNIKTRNKLLKKIFYAVSIIHLPAPAIEFNRKQIIVFHPLYF